MSETAPCDDCGATIARDRRHCPECGYEPARRTRVGTVALAGSAAVLAVTTAVLGYLLLFALQQGTLGRMGPVVVAFATVWLAAALGVVLVRRRRRLTPTDGSVL